MRIRVGDVTLFFDVEGVSLVPTSEGRETRPTVVVLHAGPGADHSLYKDTIGRRLAEVAQAIYLDQRGDGRSDRSSPARWNLETWTEDLAAFLDALEIERPVLLGSSIGALVALRYAVRYPERPSRLVLASAVARYVHARSIAAFDELGGAEAGEVAARYFGDPTEMSFAEYLPPRFRPSSSSCGDMRTRVTGCTATRRRRSTTRFDLCSPARQGAAEL